MVKLYRHYGACASGAAAELAAMHRATFRKLPTNENKPGPNDPSIGIYNDSLKLVVEDVEPPAKRLRVAHASPDTKNAEKKKAEG